MNVSIILLKIDYGAPSESRCAANVFVKAGYLKLPSCNLITRGNKIVHKLHKKQWNNWIDNITCSASIKLACKNKSRNYHPRPWRSMAREQLVKAASRLINRKPITFFELPSPSGHWIEFLLICLSHATPSSLIIWPSSLIRDPGFW